jgi:hypothetical protein|tara:strand:- start:94 stop:384 length:291 start_codon:yes stop_codon:yes gene_type:complete
MGQQTRVGKYRTTVATDRDGVTRVTYHQTAVVEFDSTTITLNTGGWATNTTKTRMNQAASQFGLGFRVYQHNFNWYVVFKGWTYQFNVQYPFTLTR